MTAESISTNKPSRRRLLAWLTLCASGSGCMFPAASDGGQERDPQRRFRGIGLVLVVDAVSEAKMEGVMIYDDREHRLYSSAIVAKRNRSIMALGGARVPLTARAVWRKNARYDYSRATWYDGTIVGDYTVPVAERIPDEVLRDIRANGGALRLKFRLKPDGVLFGWDIERPGGGISRFDMPGGDFLETRY